MPLTKRLVEPVHLCRERIPPGIKNELEFVSNNALANVILQLSNLSRHAEDIFAELTLESQAIISRSSSLKNRIERLSTKVTQLDSNVEEVTLHEINIRKHFRSSNTSDQQVVSRDTLPNAMKDVYDLCDPPPPLNRLNQFRTDGKEALKFYTDPDYFFELWRQKMLEVGHRPEKTKRPGRARTPNENKVQKVRPPQNHLDAIRAKAQEANYAPLPVSSPPHQQPSYPFTSDQREREREYAAQHNGGAYGHNGGAYDGRYGTIRSQSRPARLEISSSYEANEQLPQEETVHMVDYRAAAATAMSPPGVSAEAAARANLRTLHEKTPTRPSQPPPAPPTGSGSQSESTRSTPTSGRDNFPPPPPDLGRHSPSPHQDFPAPPDVPVARAGPAPPPPPPPPGGLGGPTSIRPKTEAGSSKPAPVQVNNTMLDARNDLLKAIRNGIDLRKVEQQQAKQQANKMEAAHKSLHNVTEILIRRRAIQHSDSESESETEADSEWGDEH